MNERMNECRTTHTTCCRTSLTCLRETPMLLQTHPHDESTRYVCAVCVCLVSHMRVLCLVNDVVTISWPLVQCHRRTSFEDVFCSICAMFHRVEPRLRP